MNIICVEFGAQIDIGRITVTGARNHSFCEIQDGGIRHLEFGFLTFSQS